MKILYIVIGVFIIILVAYISDLILTSGRLVENLIREAGIPPERVTNSPDVYILSIIYVTLLAITIIVIFHISKAIRRREGI